MSKLEYQKVLNEAFNLPAGIDRLIQMTADRKFNKLEAQSRIKTEKFIKKNLTLFYEKFLAHMTGSRGTFLDLRYGLLYSFVMNNVYLPSVTQSDAGRLKKSNMIAILNYPSIKKLEQMRRIPNITINMFSSNDVISNEIIYRNKSRKDTALDIQAFVVAVIEAAIIESINIIRGWGTSSDGPIDKRFITNFNGKSYFLDHDAQQWYEVVDGRRGEEVTDQSLHTLLNKKVIRDTKIKPNTKVQLEPGEVYELVDNNGQSQWINQQSKAVVTDATLVALLDLTVASGHAQEVDNSPKSEPPGGARQLPSQVADKLTPSKA